MDPSEGAVHAGRDLHDAVNEVRAEQWIAAWRELTPTAFHPPNGHEEGCRYEAGSGRTRNLATVQCETAVGGEIERCGDGCRVRLAARECCGRATQGKEENAEGEKGSSCEPHQIGSDAPLPGP